MNGIIIDPDKAGAERCKRPGGLAFFVKSFWDVIVPNKLVWTPHMQVLCDEIEESDHRVFLRLPKLADKIINVPPGTSKTKIVSVLSTAWEFAMMPSIKVFVGSYSDSAISGIADEIRLVVKSDKYKQWFPDTIMRKDRDALHNFKTTENGEFYAFTIGGTITSKHADILKVDDPIDPKGARSEDILETVNAFFDQTLPSRKVDKEVTITYLIMQRLADNDPSGHLIEKMGKDIYHIRLPGVSSGNVLPAKYESIYTEVELPEEHPLVRKYGNTILRFLDPKRNGPKSMAEMLLSLGGYGFSGQFDQEPTPSSGIIWQKWFVEVPDEDWPDIERGTDMGTDWDLAYTKKDGNAASAYVTSFRYNTKVFLEDFGWAWKEFPELIKWMRGFRSPHYIEAKASGISAKQTLSKYHIVAVEVPVKGGSDKIARARMATPIAESGSVCIRKSQADKMYNDIKQGILRFPKGKYMDLADTLAQCLQRHSTSGFTYHKHEQEEDEEDLLAMLDY